MIDHLGLPVSDYARSKAFYLQALAPLGAGLALEVSAEQTGDRAHAGFGRNGKPSVWISLAPVGAKMHVAIVADDRTMVDAFHCAALAAGGIDNGPPDCARTTTPTTTPPSCSIRTATTSKLSAIVPVDGVRRRHSLALDNATAQTMLRRASV